VTFLFLDEVLGEYGTQWWIGDVSHGEDQLARSLPIEELSDYIEKVASENEWVKYPPGEGWALYELNPQDAVYPRSDLYTLFTCNPSLVRDYVDVRGKWRSPFESTGADYVYASLPLEFFPDGIEAKTRGMIEDALDLALRAAKSGRCLGGGMGRQRACVDLLIYDGERSLSIVRDTLRELKVAEGTLIEYFAEEKRVHRITL
jgi:hypothetical protein